MSGNNKIRFIVFIYLIAFSLTGCQNQKMNNVFTEFKNDFYKIYSIKNIFEHFPEKIQNNKVLGGHWRPPCVENCYGDIYQTMMLDDNILQTIKKEKFLIVDTLGSYKFFKIDLDLIRDSIMDTNQNNTTNLIPIADLYKPDYNLGKIPNSIFFTDNHKLDTNYKYIPPKDLMLYVIESKAGDFWKIKCPQHRLDAHNQWAHGFSRGYAISEKEKIIVYWLAVW